VLIEKGVAKSMVHDLVTASQSNVESTGHGNPLPDPWGPYPQNLLLESGDATLEEMIGSTKKGILVTRFHYTGMIDPMKTLETGTTRDGTFWIENGKIAYPVKNLRFTQSILDALSKVELISRERKSIWGALVPALKIAEFEFSSSTLF
jgi:PmbA protein